MPRTLIPFFFLLATLGACKLTLVKTDCLRVVASEILRDGGRVSARTVAFFTQAHCKAMQAVQYLAYRERNGEPGYQSAGVPPDVLVHQVDGDTGGQPTHELSISNVDNQGSSGDFADSWQITVTYPDGDASVFSGNF